MADVAASGDQRHAVNAGQGFEGKSQTSPSKPADQSRRELVQLKWLSTLVPGAAVLVYETVRYETLEHLLPGIPPIVGNVAVAVLVLLLTYAFASFVFRVVERVQADAVRRGRELAALNAVIDERARLSRELHDGFAQLVAYMLVRLDTVTGLVEAHRAEEAMVELERMRSVTDDLYQDVRESISELRTSVSERGLPDTLHEYVDEYEERHGITVSLQGEDAARGLPALVAFQLLRIVQEALANVRKHASARTAWISFSTLQGDRLEMIVGDDGTGFDPDALPNTPRKSFGLASMRERVESLGGVLKLESSAGLGTRVIVAIPLQDRAGAPTGGSLASVTG
jgi:two-component system, NarL family, sensor histidine kinase DegS